MAVVSPVQALARQAALQCVLRLPNLESPAETSLFSNVSFVCPKPALANIRFSKVQNGAQRTFSYHDEYEPMPSSSTNTISESRSRAFFLNLSYVCPETVLVN